ncbi:hypothetical protein EUGRSUZ_I01397 [Eucalyptus grandis]|nr:hypothetical protein EUGRSUZ_I01397 [Eucalyptus grandis]
MAFRLSSPPSSAAVAEAWKWLGFVTAVWVQAISGNNYTFSNYSDALKSLMGLTQLQLNNLSVAKDVGKAFGLLAGLASDRLPTPVILLIGSVEGLLGYGAQWLVVSQRIQPLPYWQMCIFLCMGGNSTTWMNTAVLVTCIRNFRRNRGPVSGILKGFVGLSTAIFTDIAAALFSSSPSSFLLLLSLVPFAVCLSAVLFLRESPPPAPATAAAAAAPEDPKDEPRYFGAFNAVAVAIAVYLLTFDVTAPHGPAFSRVFAAGLLVLLASPLAVPAYCFLKSLTSSGGPSLGGSDMEKQPGLGDLAEPLLRQEVVPESQQKPEVVEEAAAVEKRRPAIGEDHTIFEAMRSVDFWILFVSFLCGVGTGLAVMNNMGQMGLALGYADVSMFVSLTSIWGFFGRIGSGSLSEYFLK